MSRKINRSVFLPRARRIRRPTIVPTYDASSALFDGRSWNPTTEAEYMAPTPGQSKKKHRIYRKYIQFRAAVCISKRKPFTDIFHKNAWEFKMLEIWELRPPVVLSNLHSIRISVREIRNGLMGNSVKWGICTCALRIPDFPKIGSIVHGRIY